MKRQTVFWYAAAIFAVLGTLGRAIPGMRFTAFLCWGAAALLVVFAVLMRRGTDTAHRIERVLVLLLCIGALFFALLEAPILRDAHTDAPDDVSCIVILGAGVNGTEPSLILTTRLNAALAYAADKPDVPLIVSGGQGEGEDISEARCMADYLMAHGIEAERILLEDKSTSTRENFAFSTELMARSGIDTTRDFAFVSSDFHMHRAKRIAGVPWAYGVAATLPRDPYFDALQVNYYVREAFALAKEIVFGG